MSRTRGVGALDAYALEKFSVRRARTLADMCCGATMDPDALGVEQDQAVYCRSSAVF